MKDIRMGLSVAEGSDLESLLQRFRQVETDGFQSAWIANIFGFDALTVAALAAGVTRTLELATAVVPTFSRHPFYMAQQALSTQAAAGGRFVLGLGPSHKIVIENMLGLSFDRPARHVREYVTVVTQLIETGKTSFEGEVYRVNASLNVPCESPCPVLIGALGPLMREIAGRLAGGTITWMTGPRTLGDAVVPGVRAAAKAAGRSDPRIVAGFPVVLTDDPAAAREAAGKLFALYGTLPSYRAMLDAEGLESPGDIAIAGDERAIEASLRSLASAGVTDFNAALCPFGPDPKQTMSRTQELLAELARG
ncbi:MAG: TIGR03564 family F420-dependent LLM class oxidoreductase, partial [Myxococcota bacterium]